MKSKYLPMAMMLSALAGLNPIPKLKARKERRPLYVWRCKVCGKKRKSRLQEFSGLSCEKCGNEDEAQFEVIKIFGRRKDE